MRRLLIAGFLSFTLFASPLEAGDRLVLSGGNSGDGTLRAALAASCRKDGDDEIRFAPTRADQFRIVLQTPLEIPADCNGAVSIIGSADKETVLDGSGIETGDGILIVRSWGNIIRGLTFAGYHGGAGLVLEDTDNLVQDNFFGVYRTTSSSSPNRVGLKVGSDWNTVRGNTISANLEDGILLEGDANTLQGNRIGDREGSCADARLHQEDPGDYPEFVREISHEILFIPLPFHGDGLFGNGFFNFHPSDLCGNRGAGIHITGSRNLIGGSEVTDGNRILFNDGGGIVVEATGQRNRFSRNVIAFNGGPGIRLEDGANAGIKTLRNLKAFPVETEPPEGSFRYTIFGEGQSGTRVELYEVASNEEDDNDGKWEGAKFLEGFTASGDIFSYTLERDDLPPGSRISAIVCDDRGNCSEFSLNAVLGRDSDHDGLLDPTEDPNGNLVINEGETDPLLIDTDGDGLPDSLEDRNQNGVVDEGETDPSNPDTDGDQLSDFIETGGDGDFNSREGDTDPTNPDTDDDGVSDGDEDLNHDGVIQLGETDPRNVESRRR